MLKEGLRGEAIPQAWTHQPGGTGSLPQAVVGAQGGPAAGSIPPGMDPSLRGRRVLPRWWPVLKGGLRGAVGPKARAHQPGWRGSTA